MEVPPRVVLASANPKKAAELAEILAGSGLRIELLPRPGDVPEVDEDADDFLGNARLKAAALAEATGLPALADDSGLEVDALGGAPGVHSARYAGETATDHDNVVKLLDELEREPAGERSARFWAVIVLRWPDGRELVAEGAVEGTIAATPRGDGGFGYDPVFVPVEGDGRTFAEMTADEKHAISHRGRAFRNLLAALEERLPAT
ncbi:MAG TPA: RdgB/HAM1 family non-canonical purine NTP pyrophosphatase [Microthrixaceae bacterium]|nr:RdgB/HAM1 family non-canonical purine NTP pyrophosphatase [Microthrixaceae bacterium]